ncbi:MAG: glycerophosphodiester phosphodiesterase family protein [Pyrinomonadaceae bacterium]
MPKDVNKPLIIAHRGASALAPENTLAAFQKAIDDGAEGIEFDVRLAGDGVPVVFHDPTLGRLGNMAGKVSSYSSADLQRIDVGSWFNLENPEKADSRFSRETIPTLEKLFDFLKGYRGLIYVEMKCRSEEIPTLVRAVGELIGKTDLLPQVIVKSFKLEAVALTKESFPEVYTASLFAPKILNVLHKRKHLLNKAEECRADEISLHYSLATRKLVRRARQRGLPTTIWTADNPRWVKRAFNLDINAIITNNPARLLAERRDFSSNGSSLI